MPHVYVVQESPGKNLLTASDFGTVEVLLPPNRQIMFSPQPVVRSLREKLRNFGPDDMILAMGDPAAIGVACAVAAERTGGRFKMLKWDRETARYYVVELDVFPERRREASA